MFKVSRTFDNPAASQSGFATPGAGAQDANNSEWGNPWADLMAEGAECGSCAADYEPERPTKGIFSWLFPTSPASKQRGFAEPQNALEHRPPGSMPNVPPINGEVGYNWTPYYSRGAAAYVPITGKVLTNPIGAGVVALHRPQASYGPGGEYVDHQIWWTSQAIPTSVNLQGLTNPDELAALLGQINVQAAVRVG